MPGSDRGEAAHEVDELIGALVDGRYKVLEAMASGSMGAVYKAERVPVGKVVAIKFLHAAFANDSEFLTRFERETRVMSKLAHPNCVSVVDFGVFEGAPYLVMDYVAGTTLRSIIDLGPLVPQRALALARQIAAGLAHAHAQGVVHRDVKPANIMISEEIGTGEHARILDFGLARLRGAVGRDATQSNVVVGTPNYMAPEQTVGGGTIDARTDVYAVGIVLFEMIAGERPFQAEDTLALLGMHRAAPIPKLVDRLGKGVEIPAGVQQAIEKAMAKSPDDRYQTAIQLAEAIDMIRERPSVVGGAVTTDVRASGSRRARTDPAAVAPTMQVDLSASARDLKPAKRSGNTWIGLVAVVVLLLGGGAFAAWYVKTGSDSSKQVASATADASTIDPVAFADALARTDDAAPAGASIDVGDAGDTVVASTDAGSVIDAPDHVAGGSDDPGAGSDDDPGVGSGSDTVEEIEMVPQAHEATHPAPKPTTDAEDEAADAPKSASDAERRAPVTPTFASSINEAVAMIKEGKSNEAIASLQRLGKKNPKSAYVPFLLGNLYFDKLWWTAAMDNYRVAIARNRGYRKNQTLNLNIIRMLISNKTARQAEGFIRRTIGRTNAGPYLKWASHHEKNAYVRSKAAGIAKSMGVR